MKEMGWSWLDFLATPNSVIEDVLTYHDAHRVAEKEKGKAEEAKARSSRRNR